MSGKAAGPSGVAADMLKAAGEAEVRWVTDICNEVVRSGVVPADWRRSWMVNVYKGKGNALECSSYRGIKLLDYVLKVLERVLEARLRNTVKIDDMQFGFSPGKGTTDAIFIVRQVQEKLLGKQKELWMAFVDLEKTFDRVPHEVLWWALRHVGVKEWMVNVIRSLYEGVNIGKTQVMNCKVGVGQVENSGKYPCGICRSGVGDNAIRCTSCKKWIHKKCSGVVGRLKKGGDFKCRNCSEGGMKVVDEARQFVLEARAELEVDDKFCYLGDVIGKGGGAEEASRARVRCAWGKFRDLRMLLTARGASLRVKGKVYRTCVQRVLVYGSETWPMKVNDMAKACENGKYYG